MKYLKTYEETSKTPDTKLTEEEFDSYLKRCPHLNLLDDKPIYRSINLFGKYYLIDPSIPYNQPLLPKPFSSPVKFYTHNGMKLRKSAYTHENYYTLLINHLESYSNFPKRQTICSVNKNWMGSSMYRILPLEDIRIGIVPSHDIQDGWDCNFHDKYGFTPYTLNDFYVWNKISDDDWVSFTESISKVKDGTKIRFHGHDIRREYNNDHYNKLLKLFNLKELNMEFSPENLNFNSMKYSEYIQSELYGNELWIDKPHLLMKIE